MTKKKTRKKPVRRAPVRLREKPPMPDMRRGMAVTSMPLSHVDRSVGTSAGFSSARFGDPLFGAGEDPKDKTIRELNLKVVELGLELRRGRDMFSKLLDVAHANATWDRD